MSEFAKLRPQLQPVSLSDLVSVLPDAAFVSGPGGQTLEGIAVSGVSVASDDLDDGWVFVGVPGTGRHGATFATQARDGGAVAVVTDQDGLGLAAATGLPTIVVSDARAAAALLATAFYGRTHQQIKKVGVTGTNGKTTTTYFVRAALRPVFAQSALFGTIEVDTGRSQVTADRTTHESPVVHRSLSLAAEQGSSVAVVEVSSHALDLGRVDGVHFDVGIFTNLQHDHLDFHGDMDNYLKAKARLFEPGRTDFGVIAIDDKYGRQLLREAKIPAVGVQVLTNDDPGLNDVPIWRVPDIEPHPSSGGSRFTLVSPDGKHFACVCPLPGPANVQDAALALIAASHLGVPLEEAALALEDAPPVDGRVHWIQKPTNAGPAVMVDSGHTPEAIEVLMDVVRPLTEGRIIAVFGTDGDRDATKRAPLAQMFADKADVLVITDENPRTEDPEAIRRELVDAIRLRRPDLADVTIVREGRAAAINDAIKLGLPGDLVLITGKGAERVQEWGTGPIPFYDPQIATDAYVEVWGRPSQANPS